MINRMPDVDRFYFLMEQLRRRCGGARMLRDCDARSGWPERGVYFFFESGEVRADGSTPRVVRVGTHALRPAKSTLWGRLSQHRGNLKGSKPGGGNHRGSIFRLHVGTAMLASGDWDGEINQTWGRGSSASREIRDHEYPLERAVSAYIGSMPFLWVDVDDPPSSTSERGLIERGSVALLTNLGRPPIDPSSPGWLGHSSDRTAVRHSGLWNVNHVEEDYDPKFLDVLERRIG